MNLTSVTHRSESLARANLDKEQRFALPLVLLESTEQISYGLTVR